VSLAPYQEFWHRRIVVIELERVVVGIWAAQYLVASKFSARIRRRRVTSIAPCHTCHTVTLAF
jgi:hypothetical protein